MLVCWDALGTLPRGRLDHTPENDGAAALPEPVTIDVLGLRLREWTDPDAPVMAELFEKS